MSDRPPPLTALRAFEAASRHMSFARAADELNVTAAALSFQIKSLEDHLGAPVFKRLNRAVELTEAGRALAPGCRNGFEAIAAAWQAAIRQTQTQVLSVTAGPAFTAKWLAPRLYDFAGAHPEIELRFTATLRQMDFDRDGIDIAIRYGVGEDSGLHSEYILDEAFLPLMKPELAEQYTTPERLTKAPLFVDDSTAFLSPAPDWPHWFAAHGIRTTPHAAARFSQADHAIDAALAGGGVVLARSSLALAYLASGQLVAPFEIALTSSARYRLLYRQGEETRPTIRAFRDWLLAQIERYPDVLKGKRLVDVAMLD
jgi:LysR family glycine cleavage system transcriptional activator